MNKKSNWKCRSKWLLITVLPGGLALHTLGQAFDLAQIQTVFVIPLENHDWTQACPTCSPQQLLGNPACPYINSLVTPGNSNAVRVSCCQNYYSVNIEGEHPSEPNYVWSEAGTDFGVHTSDDPSTTSSNLFTTQDHLCGQLTAAGIPWKDYDEDVEYSSSAAVSAYGTRPAGTNIYNGSNLYAYAVRHNPMEFFTDTQNTNYYPLAQLWVDLANKAVGRYNWIEPDLYNEMHSSLTNFEYQGTVYTGDQAAVAAGDNFLSIVIPQIMASQAYQNNGVIIIWMDETESTDDTNTTLPEIIISPMAKGNAYASSLPMSHSTDLKTMDEIFGLALQTNAIPVGELDAQDTGYDYVDGSSAVIYDLSDLFRPALAPFALTSIAGVTNITLSFPGQSYYSYQVQYNNNLTVPGWSEVGSAISGTDAVITVAIPAMAGVGFYRVQVQ